MTVEGGTETTGDAAANNPPPNTVSIQIAAAALAGGAVAVALGTYGRVHDPTFRPIEDFGFPSVLDMKAWLATCAAVLVLVQLTSALWIYGNLPVRRPAPRRTATVHRWSGTVAFLFTLPVAYHCLWSLGFAMRVPAGRPLDLRLRVLRRVATKMLVLRIGGLPRLVCRCGGCS